ncbi:MAG: hypothetical protein FWG20_01115 [Candidatus Cloacimonetes bacterium]|nr:hypothetical protein [Candidatus Cloacimonadota bacterium]
MIKQEKDKKITEAEISDFLLSYSDKLYNLQYDLDTKQPVISEKQIRTREGKLC